MMTYRSLLTVLLALAAASLVIGIIAKATGFVVLGLIPLSYLRFTGVCLLFVIALAAARMSLSGEKVS